MSSPERGFFNGYNKYKKESIMSWYKRKPPKYPPLPKKPKPKDDSPKK